MKQSEKALERNKVIVLQPSQANYCLSSGPALEILKVCEISIFAPFSRQFQFSSKLKLLVEIEIAEGK